MTNDSNLKLNVMRRIYFVFAVRKITGSLAVELGALAVLAGSFTFTVSIGNVLLNMPDFFDLSAVLKFFVSAFSSTEATVQILTVVTTILGALVIKNAFKTLVLAVNRPKLNF